MFIDTSFSTYHIVMPCKTFVRQASHQFFPLLVSRQTCVGVSITQGALETMNLEFTFSGPHGPGGRPAYVDFFVLYNDTELRVKGASNFNLRRMYTPLHCCLGGWNKVYVPSDRLVQARFKDRAVYIPDRSQSWVRYKYGPDWARTVNWEGNASVAANERPYAADIKFVPYSQSCGSRCWNSSDPWFAKVVLTSQRVGAEDPIWSNWEFSALPQTSITEGYLRTLGLWQGLRGGKIQWNSLATSITASKIKRAFLKEFKARIKTGNVTAVALLKHDYGQLGKAGHRALWKRRQLGEASQSHLCRRLQKVTPKVAES